MAATAYMMIIAQNKSNFNFTFRSNELITFNNVLEYYIGISDDNNAYLFTDGCATATGTNCTEVCLNATSAFDSPQNLQNCMQYANIAKAMRENRIEEQSLSLAHEMGIVAETHVESVYTTITACLNGYEKAASSDQETMLVYKDAPCVGFNGTIGSQPCYTDICAFNNLNAQMNADVGGIGVYASYYIQSSIALLCFLGFKLGSSWTFWLSWPIFKLCQRADAKSSAQACQAQTMKHIAGPLVSTAVDFQRAQCFFMLALQMAALIILFHNGKSLGSSSLQQISNNYHLIGCLSLGGILPVSFLLACLHIADRRSWYTFILSFTTMALSTTTMTYSRTRPLTAASIGPPPHQPPACGDSNPIKYCLPFDNDEGKMSWMLNHVGTMTYCWIVMIFVSIDICLHTLSRTSRIVHHSSQGGPVSKKWKFWAAVGHQFAEIAYLWGFSVYFEDLGVMNFYVPRDWAFGQIIAITVWAPIFLEFIYFELRGMRRGMQYRISKQWKLIEIDDLEDSDDAEGVAHCPSRISRFLQHPWTSVFGLARLTTKIPVVRVRNADEYSLVNHQDKGTPASDSGAFENLRMDRLDSRDSREGSMEGTRMT